MKREELDKLTTKQDFLRPKELTKEQQTQLRATTKVEREQFKAKKILTVGDIPKLVKIEPSRHMYLAKTIEWLYLTRGMKKCLDEIESRFKRECPCGFFIIISLARTAAETYKLNPKIAKNDTHCKGEAVDFAGKFMLKYFPKAAKALKEILTKMQDEGKIFFLDETTSTGFWHVARRLK